MQQQPRAGAAMYNPSSQHQSPLEFFKVYIPSFSSQKLLMPIDFVKKYKGFIPNKAVLKDQMGRSWNINIVEVGSELFFTKGWQDFVNDKFLEFGDFLIFQFDRMSVFHVKVFGKNGCKKEERPKARVKMEQTTILESTTSRPSCGFREEVPIMERAPSRTNLGIGAKHTTMKQAPSRTTLGFREANSNMEQTSNRPMRCCKRKFSNLNIHKMGKLGSHEDVPAKSMKLDFQERYMVNNVANLVAPSGPHFVAPMSACSSSNVHIPISLLKEFRVTLMKNTNLREQNGKLWPIRISRMSDGRNFITSGWREFSRQNSLQMHDHCVFELVLGNGNVCGEIKVQIYRAGLVTQKHNKYMTIKI